MLLTTRGPEVIGVTVCMFTDAGAHICDIVPLTTRGPEVIGVTVCMFTDVGAHVCDIVQCAVDNAGLDVGAHLCDHDCSFLTDLFLNRTFLNTNQTTLFEKGCVTAYFLGHKKSPINVFIGICFPIYLTFFGAPKLSVTPASALLPAFS